MIIYIPEGLALELLQLHHPQHNSERSMALPVLGSRLLPQSSSTQAWSGYHSNTQLLVPVSVLRSQLLWKNTMTISNLKRKEFILLIIPYNSPPLKDIRAGTPGRNLYTGTETNHGECYLLAYYLACWADLPIAPRTTCLGVAPLLANWALPHQSFVNKMHHRLVHRLDWWDIFLIEIFFSKVILFCVKLTCN